MKIINTNKRYSIIDVNAEDLAAQLTLIDLPIFKSIQRHEITNLANSSRTAAKAKQNLSPNIVAMTRQFNQVTFWVVGQVLSHESPRIRAELICNFIKTARRLYQLNNIHSSYAVVSALLSSPICRLDRTWQIVKKKYSKDKLQFDHLQEIFSDNNNYELLRNHLATCDLPCIPYLGVYSRDIIYISEVHPEGTIQRDKSTTKILKSIEKFQKSEYHHLVSMADITDCLLSSRYIDELQKFVEDENYRRSLELEPPDYLVSCDHSRYTGQLESSLVGTQSRHKKSVMLLASLTSMIHAALLGTSNKLGAISPRRPNTETQKALRYLIDDSFINHHGIDNNNLISEDNLVTKTSHTVLPPISTSS